MTARKSLKKRRPLPRLVGVIRSRGDLDFAIRMRNPPGLFELRLDHLVRIIDELENKLPRLRAPLIVTARHPREGGANRLSIQQRRDLLLRYLPRAQYMDVELRSVAAFRSLLEMADRKNVRRIVSFHSLKSTPDSRSLRVRARRAKSLGADVFKVATRTDTPIQLAQLLDFITNKDVDLAVSVTGIGKLGAISRVLLAYCGSALVYASIGRSRVQGQMPIGQLRSALER